MDAAAHASQLKQLLPRGALWKLEPGSILEKLLLGIAEELARIDARAVVLPEEWDPRTATETLDAWERALGIPDAETPVGLTLAERRANVTRKYVSRGGQTAAYYVALAAWLGYTVAVVETAANTWRIDVSPPYVATTTYFRVGTSRVGDRLYVRGSAVFEAVMLKWKPAHTSLSFSYL